MSQTPSIECKPNGPYGVQNLEDLRRADGSAIATKPAVSLCRCGGSANKPFCDGTHRKNGFSDAKLTDGKHDRRQDYAGKKITIMTTGRSARMRDAARTAWPRFSGTSRSPGSIPMAPTSPPSSRRSGSVHPAH